MKDKTPVCRIFRATEAHDAVVFLTALRLELSLGAAVTSRAAVVDGEGGGGAGKGRNGEGGGDVGATDADV